MFHSPNTKELFSTNTRRTTLIHATELTNYYPTPLFTPRSLSTLFEFGTNALKNRIHAIVGFKPRGILRIHLNLFVHIRVCSSFHSSRPKPRINPKRIRPVSQLRFQKAVSRLSARFTADELFDTLQNQEDPLVCLELFKWASQQHRFKHDESTYHITIKKLGVAQLYNEMDGIVNLLLTSGGTSSSSDLYNTIMYFFTKAGRLSKAIAIFKHMKKCESVESRPSLRSYKILLAAFVRKDRNMYVNRVYMDTTRSLFRQMIHDNIEPDTYSLNCVIRSYVMGLFVNDALRIFHQMGVVYSATPNSYSYDHLLHGLCAQGRTVNAKELYEEMKKNGYVPSRKSWNSYVNALALEGEIEEAVCILGEMSSTGAAIDVITYLTVIDQMCLRGNVRYAVKFLKGMQKKNVVNDQVYKKLLFFIKGR